MAEKLFEITHEPTQKKEQRNEKQIAELMLPEMFHMMLMRIQIGQSMYHQLTRCNFVRLK